MLKKTLYFLLLFTTLFFVLQKVEARENVNYWYIQNFDAKIVINKDSTLDITEQITADCGNAVGKHGIFRILPERINLTSGEKIETPVKLLSITDFGGNKINYTEIKNRSDKTITWKIGDADKTVHGINKYEIRYQVKNVTRFGNEKFDEFYWNLNGNFWDIETDQFHAEIIFPAEINEENAKVEYYTGFLGEKKKDLANFNWKNNILKFDSTRTMRQKEGITASVIFPKNIFIPYEPTFLEKYGDYLYFLIPLIIFIFCLFLWLKYGKDPHINKPIIAEYEIPGNLSPLEMGMLMKNGSLENSFITAEIINFAVKGLMTIREINDKILFFNSKDYEFIKTENMEAQKNLTKPQNILFERFFLPEILAKLPISILSIKTVDKKVPYENKNYKTRLSDHKKTFYIAVDEAKKETLNLLAEKELIVKSGNYLRTIFIVIGSLIFFSPFFLSSISLYLLVSFIISGIFIILFGLVMPKRTLAGAELNWKIKGFKLFMETVDKYRAKFYEKENIFEKFLPYAIVFGITDIWIKRMREIYGEEYFKNYAPIWYAGNLESFNVDSFTSTIDNLSSSIASNTSSPSGSGGSGSSGGGGGGGGGGGW